MKKVVLSVVAAVAMSGSAFAADMPVKAAKVAVPPPPPAFDIAFGAWVGSDYNFRGISQSNRDWSAGAYVEPQFNTPIGQFYIGTAIARIDWPSTPSYGFTDPSAEVDFYGGWRNTFGAISVDLGGIYYYYPGESFNGFTRQSDFWEVYAKLAYAITPDLTVGANGFYTPDLLHYSSTFATAGVSEKADAFYGSLTGKWVTPWKWGELGSFISGELGHWWIDGSGFSDPLVGAGDPDYTYWNIGLALTYKVFTLDLRYHGTDMSRSDCGDFLVVAAANPATKWCSDTFIATLKVDTTLSALMAK
jgi:uncharacterized protein (TIGR02001 family)